MGLLKNIFPGRKPGGKDAGPSSGRDSRDPSRYRDTEDSINHLGSQNAPRRELVGVVMRDTMRRFSIPSDWVDCRILSVMTRKHKAGMHVQFIVKKNSDQLLPYVHAFQDGFWLELEKFDPRPREWLFSLGWQFEGHAKQPLTAIPGLEAGWDQPDTEVPQSQLPEEMDTQPPDTLPPEQTEELESDLQQLYAIRDAALSQPADLASLPPVPAGAGKGPPRR